jgi:hypothetical protein
MGRWAQRRRGSGGGGPAQIQMTAATISGGDQATVTYNVNVTAAEFSAADFQSLPTTEVGSSIAQGAANELVVTFGGSIFVDTQLIFTGPNPDVLSPQTINYT